MGGSSLDEINSEYDTPYLEGEREQRKLRVRDHNAINRAATVKIKVVFMRIRHLFKRLTFSPSCSLGNPDTSIRDQVQTAREGK